MLFGLVSVSAVNAQTDTPSPSPSPTITNTPAGLPTLPPLTPSVFPTRMVGSLNCPGYPVYYDEVDLQYVVQCRRCLSERPEPTKNVSYGIPQYGLPQTPLHTATATVTGTPPTRTPNPYVTEYPTVTPDGDVPTLTVAPTNTPTLTSTPVPTNTPSDGEIVFAHFDFNNPSAYEFDVHPTTRVFGGGLADITIDNWIEPTEDTGGIEEGYITFEYVWDEPTWIEDVLFDVHNANASSGQLITIAILDYGQTTLRMENIWIGTGDPFGADYIISPVSGWIDINYNIDLTAQYVVVNAVPYFDTAGQFIRARNFETNYESFGGFLPTSTPSATYTPSATFTPAPTSSATPYGYVDCSLPFAPVDREEYVDLQLNEFVGENCPAAILGPIDATSIDERLYIPQIELCIKWVSLPVLRLFNISVPLGTIIAVGALMWVWRFLSQW